MMKNASVSAVFGIVLFLLVVWLCGCSQYGETTAEGNRRHIRNLRLNQEGLTEDVDRTMLFDDPNPLTDKRIP
jgi:hypothetical protein